MEYEQAKQKLIDKIDSLEGRDLMYFLIQECMDSQLYFEAQQRLYELEPSASSASEMGKMNISRKKYYITRC